ncbi:putative ABC transporter ATP-binding protein [Anaerotignum neopropionicum]|uniref:Putative ABC transporter ATP-binding protein n=1 Tax=Anaerotignum neopropionicum TaxID=36847 RepID=A0A136WF76_9FIRM|nr:ABC transporter ATP-binding protein [Anaerotignum neopropionicum]KXL53202.1 putative ABC transporter ATP-binding protein [Anaerotignum neopropionicum]
MNNPHMGGRPPASLKKPKNTKKTLARLLKYLNKYWLQLTISIICIAFVTLGTVFATRLIGVAIDKYIITFDFQGLAKVCSMLFAIYVGTSLCMWIQSNLFLHVGQSVVATIRKEIFEKIQRLPLKYFDNTTHGEIMSRVTNDVDNISMALNSSVSQVFQSGLTLIGTLAMMLYLSIPLTIATIITIPVMLIATKAVASRSRRYYKEKQERLGKLNGFIEEIISGQKVVKVFCQEEEITDSFSKKNTDLLEVGMRAEIFSGIVGPIMMALNNVTYAIVVVGGGLMMVMGLPMTLGTISNFIIYSKQFTRPLNELANQVNAMMAAFAGAERVFEVLDEEEELEDAPESVELKAVRGDVVFSNVDFSYEEGHPILKEINLYAKPGQTIALVGPTGAGKTTIINLLTRFYDIAKGTITIDGYDIKDIKRKNIRSTLGIVLQDTYLFTDTIRENIRYGRLNATDEEIIEAAKLANAHEFIRRLPDGYDTVLSDSGGNLSQGQRQMLAISRAILANPSILILDEATSSVDTRTEVKIQEAMHNLMKGRTNFVIAHRLSTIREADLIAVINHGEIIERGNHKELMETKGFYYNLYRNQFESNGAG